MWRIYGIEFQKKRFTNHDVSRLGMRTYILSLSQKKNTFWHVFADKWSFLHAQWKHRQRKYEGDPRNANEREREAKLTRCPILHKSRETRIANARPPIGILSLAERGPTEKEKGKGKKGGRRGKKRERERETCRFHSGLIDAQHPRGAIKIPVSHSIIFFTLQPWPVIHSPVYLAYSPIDLLALRCVPCPGIDKISKLGRSYGLDMVGSRRRKKGTWRNSRFVS